MAYITKRGSSYSVRYTYQDEHGKRVKLQQMGKFFYKRGGNKSQKQIEHELANGTFLIPSTEKVHRSSFPPE